VDGSGSAPARSSAVEYQRHEPEQTVLYEVARENLESFLTHTREQIGKPPIAESQRRRRGLEIAPAWDSRPPTVANLTMLR
jgi:hypothetical protein